MRKIRAIVIILGIMQILTACSTAPADKKYYDIELYMTYSEVVALIGEPDNIVDASLVPWDENYIYEWKFIDGNKLQLRLQYPGKRDKENNHKYPNDFVVAHCIIINETFAPTSQTTSVPT